MKTTQTNFKKELKRDLVSLLNIHGVSGKERAVRNFIKPVLESIMDKVQVDHYGNLLGDMKIGTGEGATILLSAHMDTVKGVLAKRRLITSDGGDIISSDVGALGADDRAGMAVILSVLKNIKSTNFNGNIKVAFSRQEEVGCIGAGKISKKWYENSDLAIVVDRRGSRDIVVGCWDAFCSTNTGLFFEEASSIIGEDWKCVEGGISDATVFSTVGVNSVNLSTGYYNEHTANEYVSLSEMNDTLSLILSVMDIVDLNTHMFGEVPVYNEWVYYTGSTTNVGKDYDYLSDYVSNYSDSTAVDYEEFNKYSEFIYAEYFDESIDAKDGGDVIVYEYGSNVVISQGNNRIETTKEGFRSLLSQLINYS